MIQREDHSCKFEGDEPEVKTETKTNKYFGSVLFELYR